MAENIDCWVKTPRYHDKGLANVLVGMCVAPKQYVDNDGHLEVWEEEFGLNNNAVRISVYKVMHLHND